MAKKLLYIFMSFMLVFFLTSFAKDISDMALGRQPDTWFNNTQTPIKRLISAFIFCWCSLAAYYIFIKLYASKGLFKSIVVFLLAIVLIISFRYIIDQIVCPYLFGFRNYPRNVGLYYYYLDSLWYCFYYSTLGLAFFFFEFVKKKELEQKEAQLQNRIAELSFLKAQINPHFLFNSINNIYSLVATEPQKALPVLDQLSTLIRYMLYEDQERVPLKKELKYLIDYIELHKLRYINPQRIEVNLSLESMDLWIAPLLLLPFVENLFKHAELNSVSDKAAISIETKRKHVILKTWNKKRLGSSKMIEGIGIGLNNTSRRLKLIYPLGYSLDIKDTEDSYEVELIVELERIAL
jgi:two-component system LytT family sensor kinase